MQMGKGVLGIVLAFLLGGCAGVTFYSDASLKNKSRTGLVYYPPKPYLLVTRTGNKDAPLKAEIIYLPDLKQPFYAVYRAGWGTHQFNLKLTNGILTEYGQTTDSKGPETIKAVGDLAASVGSAATGFGGLLSALKSPTAGAANQANDVGAAKDAIGKAIAALNELTTDKFPHLTAALSAIQGIKDRLQAQSQLAIPSVAALEAIGDSLSEAAILAPQTIETEGYNKTVSLAGDYVKAAIRALAEKEPPKPDVELYEIVVEAGKTKLIRCKE